MEDIDKEGKNEQTEILHILYRLAYGSRRIREAWLVKEGISCRVLLVLGTFICEGILMLFKEGIRNLYLGPSARLKQFLIIRESREFVIFPSLWEGQ